MRICESHELIFDGKAKDEEIKQLKATLDSEQELYDAAINYVSEHWDTFFDTLTLWEAEHGQHLRTDLTESWEYVLQGAQKYGSFLDSIIETQKELKILDEDSGSSSSGSSKNDNTKIADTHTYDHTSHAQYDVIDRMHQRSEDWEDATPAERERMSAEQQLDADALYEQKGILVQLDKPSGEWIIKEDKFSSNGESHVGKRLYDVYKKNQLFLNPTYHVGGIAGEEPGLKNDEIMAKLQKGEVIISNSDKYALYDMVEFVSKLSNKMGDTTGGLVSNPFSEVTNALTVPNVSKSDSIHFGDVYIYGNAGEDTVAKHKEINRKFANDILSYIKMNK